MSGGRAVLAVVLLAAGGAFAVVAIRGPEAPGTPQDRVRAVASTLRCPVCQDLSVADSPSALAGQMRAQIAQELRAGMTPQEIRAGFVRSYGDWILLAPPRRGINLVAWAAPVLLLLGGIAMAFVALNRWTRARGEAESGSAMLGTESVTADDRRLLGRALAAMEEEPE
jgi:cytochrome c-type biogenesis protein CcmH